MKSLHKLCQKKYLEAPFLAELENYFGSEELRAA
jgi:hypothetical protein